MKTAFSRVAESAVGAAAAELRETGYAVLPKLQCPRSIQRLAGELQPWFDGSPFCSGLFNGERTKRVHGLLKRSVGAAALVTDPTILGIAEDILSPWCDNLQLNLTQAIEIHSGELAQIPHRDQDMWPAGGTAEYMLNIMWPLDPFSAVNGSTRLWPGSNRDTEGPEDREPVALDLEPGDALLFLGSTLHGAGPNATARPRRGLLVSYCLGWLKPYENMWLTYPPHVARRFDEPLQRLVGYCRHRPNLGNYDGQCPSVLLGRSSDRPLGASDALGDRHRSVIAEFAAAQTSRLSGAGVPHTGMAS